MNCDGMTERSMQSRLRILVSAVGMVPRKIPGLALNRKILKRWENVRGQLRADSVKRAS